MRLIDRDALIDKLELRYKFSSGEIHRAYRTALDDAYDAPIIAPLKNGRWDYYSGVLINSHFRCSVCRTPRYEHYAVNEFKYCPHCGAKMDANE